MSNIATSNLHLHMAFPCSQAWTYLGIETAADLTMPKSPPLASQRMLEGM